MQIEVKEMRNVVLPPIPDTVTIEGMGDLEIEHLTRSQVKQLAKEVGRAIINKWEEANKERGE